ncbi:MAG TPA: hypothetical protein EYO59_12140, partial [Chromatiaceae bacterium]|nr:hypothetical protein [Chromatiaceae bacterium]
MIIMFKWTIVVKRAAVNIGAICGFIIFAIFLSGLEAKANAVWVQGSNLMPPVIPFQNITYSDLEPGGVYSELKWSSVDKIGNAYMVTSPHGNMFQY